MTTVNKRIKVLKNGPYRLIGDIPMNRLRYVPNERGASVEYEEIEKYSPEGNCFLCRCGKSLHTPFCDGRHSEGFDGTETAPHTTFDEMAGYITGKQMDLMDAEELCAFARFCTSESDIWTLVEQAEGRKAEDLIIHQSTYCPAGRLTAVTKEGVRIEPDLPQEISILEDPVMGCIGPVWVKGGIEIEDENGQVYPVRNRVTLCRCGRSENKPFCDGAHLPD